MLNTEGRHPAVVEFQDMFDFDHLPEGKPRDCSETFHTFAQALLDNLDDAPGLTRCLHRLWEAKNEAVFLAVRRS
jgi:hypothetical protein